MIRTKFTKFKPTFRRFAIFAVAWVSALSLTLGLPLQAYAAVNNPAPAAQVSFTFDDAYISFLEKAAPTLAKYGIPGTMYAPTNCIGSQGVCEANEDSEYMTWAQVNTLRNTYGWEIGAHTANHRNLPQLTPAEREAEINESHQDFLANGIPVPTTFASPEGDYDPASLATVAKYYAAHRGFHDTAAQNWPYNDYILNVRQVQMGISVDSVKAAIDQAVANKQWLILVFHDIQDNPNPDPEAYEYATADLDAIAAYAKAKQNAGQLAPIKMSQGLVTSDTNLLANGGFTSGNLSGWTTDSPASITYDGASRGNYPSAVNSVRITSTAANTHLFSQKVPVAAGNSYMVKHYQNATSASGGVLSYYIDEYNAAGQWVSGQFKGTDAAPLFPKTRGFTYAPTSTAVTQASVQFIVPANSGIVANIDNVQFFALNGSNPTPPPPPPPPPAAVNLLPNGTFDAGISGGWSTDVAASITPNNQNQGSPANPVNSISLVATTRNAHLFSSLVNIDNPINVYSVTTFVRLNQRTANEVGFYIDEYDANNNWISGQYKGGVTAISAADFTFQYKATNANVKKARYQVILPANSGIRAFVDHVRFFKL